MSLALYRKYRPQKFGDLIGQDSLVSVLQNSLKSDKLHHAYLFIGSRGTGKTSTARIMAKAINCTNFNKEKLEPCSECNICISIANGSYLDLIEIDAASNRGIDDIRDLRDKIKLAPTEGKFKVYIIDEVHMLTNEAFNALLKTLEEPPAHALFILCTTDPQKLPATIVSSPRRL
ncbi:MAG: DNA polymerase III, subunit gamma and tau, partial [Candidatus Woykebacteria bacterium RIFCSPHIGHO2_01_FULL_43_29]